MEEHVGEKGLSVWQVEDLLNELVVVENHRQLLILGVHKLGLPLHDRMQLSLAGCERDRREGSDHKDLPA